MIDNHAFILFIFSKKQKISQQAGTRNDLDQLIDDIIHIYQHSNALNELHI
jgi:uncharacterized protein YihD (DUF1040 family)